MRLHPGALHIWHADLDAANPEIGELLDAREQERAMRIVREPARRRWKAARGTLRMLLGAYSGVHPCALRLTQDAYGKPVLDPPRDPALHFNLSHSGGLAIYAMTEMCAVGVDVELIGRCSGKRIYDRSFLRTWVVREARAKRLGLGLGNMPAPGKTSDTETWIAELDLRNQAVGAVAMAIEPVDFQVNTIDFRGCVSILPASTIMTHKDEQNVSKPSPGGDSTVARKRSITQS